MNFNHRVPSRSSVAAAVFFVVTSAGLASTASAQFVAPSWRGGTYSTYQQWDFTSSPGLGAPNVAPSNTPYGMPNMSTIGNMNWSSSASVPPMPGGGPGAWTGDSSSTTAALCNENRNVPIEFRLTFGIGGGGAAIEGKVDFMQIAFYGAVPDVSVSSIAGYGDFTAVETSREIVEIGGGWRMLRMSHSYFTSSGFSPERELFVIAFPVGNIGWIGGISFDTQVIPTPSAATLLGLGGLMAGRRRRN